MNGRCRPTHLLVAGLLSAAFHAGVAPTPTNASQLSFPTSFSLVGLPEADRGGEAVPVGPLGAASDDIALPEECRAPLLRSGATVPSDQSRANLKVRPHTILYGRQAPISTGATTGNVGTVFTVLLGSRP